MSSFFKARNAGRRSVRPGGVDRWVFNSSIEKFEIGQSTTTRSPARTNFNIYTTKRWRKRSYANTFHSRSSPINKNPQSSKLFFRAEIFLNFIFSPENLNIAQLKSLLSRATTWITKHASKPPSSFFSSSFQSLLVSFSSCLCCFGNSFSLLLSTQPASEMGWLEQEMEWK